MEHNKKAPENHEVGMWLLFKTKPPLNTMFGGKIASIDTVTGIYNFNPCE